MLRLTGDISPSVVGISLVSAAVLSSILLMTGGVALGPAESAPVGRVRGA